MEFREFTDVHISVFDLHDYNLYNKVYEKEIKEMKDNCTMD